MSRRAAVLRLEEAAGQIMGLLMGLDAVRFLLLVDPPADSLRAAGGLMGGLRQYLPQPWARQEHIHLSTLSAEQQKHFGAVPVSNLDVVKPWLMKLDSTAN